MNFDLDNLRDLRRGSVTLLKSVHSKEKDEACLSFVVKFFTKYLQRGGVIDFHALLIAPSPRFWQNCQPYSNERADYANHITIRPPEFSDLPQSTESLAKVKKNCFY